MEITKISPPVSGFLQIKLDQEIIDYLLKIIDIAKTKNQNHKNHLAGNISQSFLIDDQDSLFFKSVCIPLVKYYRKESHLGEDPVSHNALLGPKSELVLEETFGPIIPIIRVPDVDEEVISISNSTAFGLSSGVCTNNFMRAKNYIQNLDVGTVNIWEVPGYRIEMSPFGGIKDSGLGYKEGVIEAMKSFTNVKTFSLPW